MTITLIADATHEIKRPNVPALDAILGHAFKALDHGFVRLIDYMGDDAAITQAARVSYGAGTKTLNDDRGLIRYLMRHWHSTPFEMCEIKLHFKMPMFVGEQTLRHRTANINKESGRYSVMSNDKYVPSVERLAKQSSTNKQGSGSAFDEIEAMRLVGEITFMHSEIQALYDRFVSGDVDMARELSRGILPANQYAEFYWKIDLHNLFHFMRLRSDGHAQYEIRVYSEILEEIVKLWVPMAYEAWVDYRRDAVNFSRMEMAVLRHMLDYGMDGGDAIIEGERLGMGQRERFEFLSKLGVS